MCVFVLLFCYFLFFDLFVFFVVVCVFLIFLIIAFSLIDFLFFDWFFFLCFPFSFFVGGFRFWLECILSFVVMIAWFNFSLLLRRGYGASFFLSFMLFSHH